ncbi:hypothetical protein VNI00_017649 [Paramarasmius palmivorus]|uniref:HNH nuclease domain-containing protein n=1 Tax=Paramarasmius palmivorus TaxID=297713 RepID=A0AAW0B3T9_9AGAR
MLHCIVPKPGDLRHKGKRLGQNSNHIVKDGDCFTYKVDYVKGFIADPKGMIERSTIQDSTQAREPDFRERVMHRDQALTIIIVNNKSYPLLYPFCVLTEHKPPKKIVQWEKNATGCHAIHLFPHARHDPYISFMSQGLITKVDDVRNGLLVTKRLHTYLGQIGDGSSPIPNKYMTREDVKVSDHPSDQEKLQTYQETIHFHVMSIEHKYHHIELANMLSSKTEVWDGKIVRLPREEYSSSKVPDTIWDHHYGVVALCTFAEQDTEFMEFIKDVQAIYNEGGGPYMPELDTNQGNSDHSDDPHPGRRRGGGGSRGGGSGRGGSGKGGGSSKRSASGKRSSSGKGSEEGAAGPSGSRARQRSQQGVQKAKRRSENTPKHDWEGSKGIVSALWTWAGMIKASQEMEAQNMEVDRWRQEVQNPTEI